MHACLETNICYYNGEVYRFMDGLSMGSPLSSLVADIFMSQLEKDIMDNSHSSSFSVKFWRRYVDDIICVWDGTEPDLSRFFNEMNAYHPSMEFTLEIGGDQIHFLDLTLHFKEFDSQQKTTVFNIYRKETFTGDSINGSSLHPQSQKLAAI